MLIMPDPEVPDTSSITSCPQSLTTYPLTPVKQFTTAWTVPLSSPSMRSQSNLSKPEDKLSTFIRERVKVSNSPEIDRVESEEPFQRSGRQLWSGNRLFRGQQNLYNFTRFNDDYFYKNKLIV